MTGFFSTTPSTTTAIKFGCSDCGGSGTTPSFSSNGTTNAILWTLDNTGREKTAAILHAYDPANLKSEFYNSGQAANGRDAAAVAVKFTTPVVAHGRVYVGGIDAVTVYGELSPSMAITASPSTIAPGATATLAVTHAGTGQVTISGSDHTSYTIPATGGTQIVTPANTTTYTATATGNDGFQVSATTDVTVVPITLSASSATITAGASSTLSVVAASTTKVVITGTDGTSYTLPPTGGTQVVSPSATTTYTAASTMSSGPVSASAVVTVTPAQAGCLPSSARARICQPTAGAAATAPVTITAGAIAASGYITAVRAYVDNIAVFTVNNPRATNSQQVSQAVSLGAGTHYLVIIGYLSKGGNVQTSEHFMVGAPTGCYPSTEGTKICSPSQDANVTSPVQISAGATTLNGYLTSIGVYTDGVQQTLVNNPQQSQSFAISLSLPVASGTHLLAIVGQQSTGGTVTASESITAGLPTSCAPPSSSGAVLCSPVNGSTSHSPVQISAGATAPNGYLTAINVYVDNIKQIHVINPRQSQSFSFTQSLSMTVGNHKVVIVGYPSTGGAVVAQSAVGVN